MNERHEFDDLARRKLEERQFAFDEAAWSDVERTLAGQRRDRGGWVWWTISGAALLLIGFMVWRSMSVEPATSTVVSNQGVATPVEDHLPAENQNGTIATEEPDQVAPKAVEVASPIKNPAAHTPTLSAPEQTRNERQVADQRGSAMTQKAEQVAAIGTVTDQAVPIPAVEPESGTQDIVGDAVVPVQEPANTTKEEPIPALVIAPVIVGTLAGNEVSGSVATAPSSPATTDPGNIGSTTEDAANTTTTEPTSEPVTEAPLADQTDSGENVPPPAPVATATDSTATTATNDAAVTPTAAAAVAPVIIAAASPWEISVLGGYFTTTSSYGGPGSDTWNVEAQRTPGFGGEWMHMGRNFGVGTGLHYGTYADRLVTPEEYRTIFTPSQSWYFVQVDTAVLIITGYDPVTGNYTGQSVNMTINELRMALDSSSTTVLVREARERINRTSYLELPLLLDAHLVQGRWSFGVRGGPTLGLLTQRQGSIPSDDGEGYTEFNDVAMRSLTFGWTARAYVRYRFNSAWSVGLEPAARGQFVDGFDQQGVTRRSNAMGCMLSLSYRLR